MSDTTSSRNIGSTIILLNKQAETALQSSKLLDNLKQEIDRNHPQSIARILDQNKELLTLYSDLPLSDGSSTEQPNGFTIAHLAAQYGNDNTLLHLLEVTDKKILLQQDASGNTPLHMLSRRKMNDTIFKKLNNKASTLLFNLNADNPNPFQQYNNEGRLFFEEKHNGISLLNRRLEKGCTDLVHLIKTYTYRLKTPTDNTLPELFNKQDCQGRTPLHALIQGETAIQWSTENDRNPESIEAQIKRIKYSEKHYLESGNVLDTEEKNHPVKSSLKLSMFELLLRHTNDFTTVNREGDNILHTAAKGGLQEIVEKIFNSNYPNVVAVKHVEYLKQKNTAGQTAQDLAQENGHTKTAETLEKRMKFATTPPKKNTKPTSSPTLHEKTSAPAPKQARNTFFLQGQTPNAT